VETSKNKPIQLLEIHPLGEKKNVKGGVFAKGRILLGRSESCDLCVSDDSVSAVHAVLELFEDKAILYDMNSTNGSYVNGEKVVAKEIRLGEVFSLAKVDFRLNKYISSDDLPPVLDSLEPAFGKASIRTASEVEESKSKQLPKTPGKIDQLSYPKIVYPLAADPKAEFSEYIFEDKETIYPIFKYESSQQSVEVIILFKDKIFSVDYLPEGKLTYFISGVTKGKEEVEFPYLGKNEKFPFINISSSYTTVYALPGFEIFLLSDKKNKTTNPLGEVQLSGQDIVRLFKDDLQIFIRNVSAPPKVASAPVLKRDADFQKYLTLLLGLVLFISVAFNLIEVPVDEKKDELAPERLATILYKQPLTVSKNKAVAKTEDAPKNIAQAAPPKPAVEKETPKAVQPEIKKPDVIETKVQNQKPDPGERKATEKKIVKQGQPQAKPQTSPKQPQNNAPSKLAQKSNPVKAASSASLVNLKSSGHVEVYKSADFKSSISSLVAKGGSLSGIQTKGVGSTGGDLVGASSGIASGSGSIKTAEISTSQGSLVGATSGTISSSKGAEGLSAKRAVYTAGIPSDTVVLGSMDPDVIRRILLDHLPQFRYCYQKELERSGAEMSGTVKLNFTIGASGHVSQAGIDGSSGLPTDVKKCVIGVLRGISFPEPMGGGTVEVKQPMNFYPKKI
jgi:outer membrane biosynthesis protein TonB